MVDSKLYDVLIYGSGPAGITLAKKISENKKLNILLIDGGNLRKNKKNFKINLVNQINNEINPINLLKLREFGGTTNHWGGYCRPYDKHDFYDNSKLTNNKWPLNFETFSKYELEAKKILNLKNSFEVKSERNQLERNINTDLGIEEIEFDYSYRKIFLEKYNSLKNIKNIKIILNQTLKKFVINYDKLSIHKVETIDSNTKQEGSFRSKLVILALGGVENARALLIHDKFENKNFFNYNDLVGRGFMDHPHWVVGNYVGFEHFHSNQNLKLNKKYVRFFKPTYQFQKKNNILNSSMRLISDSMRYGYNKSIIDNFNSSFPNSKKKIRNTGVIYVVSEQDKEERNRIFLSDKTDPFNLPLLNFDYSIGDKTLSTIRKSAKLISTWLLKNDYGRGRLDDWIINENMIVDYTKSEWYGHHIGTTRMGIDKKTSVVDINNKIHSLKNLYISGSSTFPTGGASNPTFFIIQMSLHLGDHIKNLKI